ADDGPMPQTREHLDILTLLDVRHGVVVLTKIDRVSAEELRVVRQVVAEFLRGTFLADAPIVHVSNVTGDGLGELYEVLTRLVGSIRPKPVDGVFRMPVERAFSIKGHGTVIAGVPIAGSARVDDEIVLLPDGLAGRIKSIQVYGQASETVLAGQCAAINVRHWDHRVVERGKTVTVPGFCETHGWCVGQLRLLPAERLFLKHGSTVKFHTGTSEHLARVYLLAGEGLHGGAKAFAQFRLEEPIVTGPRDRFIVRDPSPPRTIGGGIILEAMPRRLNRNQPGLLDLLQRQLAAMAEDVSLVEFCAATTDSTLIEPAAVARRGLVPLGRTAAIMEDLAAAGTLVRAPDRTYLHRVAAERIELELLDRLTAFHRDSPESPGVLMDELRQTWDVPPAALQAVVDRLRSAGRIAVADQRLALADHRPAIGEADADPLARVEALFQTRRFNPPDTAEIAAALALAPEAVQRLVRILIEHRRLVRIDRDFVFHGDAVRQAREKIVTHIHQHGRLESVDFKYTLDTTRKYALPLLDYFDRTGLTKRSSDNTRLLRNPEGP
ncbi:MAG: SelB C-terminal domain-containing protein, partial [Planctomycetes bacterium]|nr:SelB C-terminal domain-containing protein [Planctomycetota bacterium]